MTAVVDRWVKRMKGRLEPVGEMSHWERLESAFRRRRTDYVPVAPELDYYQITHAGYGHEEIYNDVDKTTDATDDHGHVQLSVRDNGCGFDAEKQSTNGHFGLGGMRERAEQMGGSVSVNSRPGAGTEVTVRVPIEA